MRLSSPTRAQGALRTRRHSLISNAMPAGLDSPWGGGTLYLLQTSCRHRLAPGHGMKGRKDRCCLEHTRYLAAAAAEGPRLRSFAPRPTTAGNSYTQHRIPHPPCTLPRLPLYMRTMLPHFHTTPSRLNIAYMSGWQRPRVYFATASRNTAALYCQLFARITLTAYVLHLARAYSGVPAQNAASRKALHNFCQSQGAPA